MAQLTRMLQFTLDLFANTPHARPQALPAPQRRPVKLRVPGQIGRPKAPQTPGLTHTGSAPDLLENVPQAPMDVRHNAIDLIVSDGLERHTSREPLPPPAPAQYPAQPLAHTLAPAQFRHPQANRTSALGDAQVAYLFRRGKRKTIGFVVGPDGLVVSAPRWVGVHDVERALQERGAWILRKLGEARERQQHMASARIEWRDGVQFPYLGEPVQLVLDPRHGFSRKGVAMLQPLTDLATSAPCAGAPATLQALHVGLAHDATAAQMRDAVQAWLMQQALQVFTERLNHFAPLLGVQWRKLGLSNAGTRWGSARVDGSIRLNWRLIHFNPSVIDYVVAHELSHLRVMDHSPRFWDTVRSVVPDYAQRRGQLKAEPVVRWD